MARHLLVVHNPAAGNRSRSQRMVREFHSYIEAKDFDYQFLETTPEIDAKGIVTRHLTSSHSDLVVLGGDGSLNEAVNGLKYDVPVTLIPSGSGNDFMKNLPVGKTLKDQLSALVSGKTMSIDVGVCNGRKFLNGVGIGFDGQIVEEMINRPIPFLQGHAKYYYHVLRILATYRDQPFRFKIDQKLHEDYLILMTVANGTTFGGGFKLTPRARIDDGLLEICTIGHFPAWKRFFHVHKLSTGSHGQLEGITFHQAKTVQVAPVDGLFAHIDGEPAGNPPFTIELLPSALTIRIS